MSEEKSVWDSCSTVHVSISDRVIAALATVANDKGITRSKVVQLLLMESKTLNNAIDNLDKKGIFSPCDTRYKAFRNKEKFLKEC